MAIAKKSHLGQCVRRGYQLWQLWARSSNERALGAAVGPLGHGLPMQGKSLGAP
jgi:hypothetical protein